jgi:hypothetical protein
LSRHSSSVGGGGVLSLLPSAHPPATLLNSYLSTVLNLNSSDDGGDAKAGRLPERWMAEAMAYGMSIVVVSLSLPISSRQIIDESISIADFISYNIRIDLGFGRHWQ